MNAYPEIYLNHTMTAMGELFDYSINTAGISGPELIGRFLTGVLSKRMENGEAAALVGRSGLELAEEVLGQPVADSDISFSRSPEYWCGWAAAYYQWYSCRPFSQIFTALPFDQLMQLYHTQHEADLSHVCEVFDARLKKFYPETNLKRFRSAYGCSQQKLAEMAGVSLRSIQMYEQRNKDINKAQGETIYRLARCLGCRMEDLLEPC